MKRVVLALSIIAALAACKGEDGPTGNQGSVGPKGPQGPAGAAGTIGGVGAAGMNGPDGEEGGTPYLLTNALDGVIQYGDGDNTVELGNVQLVSPIDGGFLVRIHYRGTVAKRDGVGFCRVAIRLMQNDDLNPVLEELVGIHGAPTAGKLEISVGGSMITLVPAPQNQPVRLRVEIQRFDERCADGAGPTQIARIAAQIDATFHRFALNTE